MDPQPGLDGPFYIIGAGGREVLFPCKEEYSLSLLDPSRVDPCQFRNSPDHEQYLLALGLDPATSAILPVPTNIFPVALYFNGYKVWFWTAEHYVRAHMGLLSVAEVQYLTHPRHKEYVARLSTAFSSPEYKLKYNQLLDLSAAVYYYL